MVFAASVQRLRKQSVVQRYLENAFQLARLHLADSPLPAECRNNLLISFVVPVFNTKPRYLNDLLISFRRQLETGAPCELILSDDGSGEPATLAWLARQEGVKGLRIVRAAENGGIAQATNRGIAAAQGAWIGLLDHDDTLAPYAAALITDTLLRNRECQFLYTDEVVTDGRLRPLDCFLKPAWDPVLLSGVNYINHLALYRRDRLLAIGGLRRGFEGSQDYDLVLRYTAGLDERHILHLPYPAYFWRRDGSSYSVEYLGEATQAARRALAEAYSGIGLPVPVGEALKSDLHRVRFDQALTDWPLVSIVIPSFENFDLISKILEGVFDGTDYPNLEIIVVDNGSRDPAVLALYAKAGEKRSGFQALVNDEPFNFSRSVNRGLAVCTGSMILLLNNDVEVIKPDWLKEMVSCMSYNRVGIVGAKLVYPDGTLQHAGVIVGFGRLAGHWFVGAAGDFAGPMGRLRVRQSFSAVTGACMLVSRDCLHTVGPFDEEAFAIAYNDIDYCLRALAAGYRILWTPFAELTHQESATRGSDEAPDKIRRFQGEQANLRSRHGTDSFEDRAVNPWWAKDRSDLAVRELTALPGAR